MGALGHTMQVSGTLGHFQCSQDQKKEHLLRTTSAWVLARSLSTIQLKPQSQCRRSQTQNTWMPQPHKMGAVQKAGKQPQDRHTSGRTYRKLDIPVPLCRYALNYQELEYFWTLNLWENCKICSVTSFIKAKRHQAGVISLTWKEIFIYLKACLKAPFWQPITCLNMT